MALIRIALILVVVILAGYWVVDSDSAAAADVSGVYRCEGVNGDGSRYEGVVVITKRRDTYDVQWILESQLTTIGVGIREGDTLAVSYFSSTPALIVYRIDGGKLIGRWTVAGADGRFSSETLTLLKDHPTPTPKPTAAKPRIRV